MGVVCEEKWVGYGRVRVCVSDIVRANECRVSVSEICHAKRNAVFNATLTRMPTLRKSYL